MSGAVVLTFLVAVAWLSGHIVAGKGDPSLQCARVHSNSAVLQIGDDPAVSERGAHGDWLVWPTGIGCTTTDEQTGARETTWYITWASSLAILVLAVAVGLAVSGTLAPDRTMRVLRQRPWSPRSATGATGGQDCAGG